VFQAYLTTFLIEPGYEKPIKTVEEMLNSEMPFGFKGNYKFLFPDTSDPVDSVIVEDAVECHDDSTCYVWASTYHNISTILDDWQIGYYRGKQNWADEYNRPLLCELEDGVVRTMDFVVLLSKRSPFFEFINNAKSHIVEGGIFMHMIKRGFEKEEIQAEFYFHTYDEEYSVYCVSHLQTAFYLLMMGCMISVACFVTEIKWHGYRSKGRERTSTSLCHGQT
jgi:hypothetical protein